MKKKNKLFKENRIFIWIVGFLVLIYSIYLKDVLLWIWTLVATLFFSIANIKEKYKKMIDINIGYVITLWLIFMMVFLFRLATNLK